MPDRRGGNLIAGSGNNFIATLVERHTRIVMLAEVGNEDNRSVVQALVKQSSKVPRDLYRSLTWDRGTEIAGHRKFSLARISMCSCATLTAPLDRLPRNHLPGNP